MQFGVLFEFTALHVRQWNDSTRLGHHHFLWEGLRMPWLPTHKRQIIFVQTILHWCFLREKCPIMSFLLARLIRNLSSRLQAYIATIATNLDTLSYGLKVVVELYKSLLSFLRAKLHEQGYVWLYVKSGNIERAICCRRYFDDEKRVGSLDEMAAFVQYDTIYIQMSSLIDNCVALSRSWHRCIQTLITSPLVIGTKCNVLKAFV